MSDIIIPSSGGGSPTGSAGGDLGGTYPNPSVGSAVSNAMAFTSTTPGVGIQVQTASKALYLEGKNTATGAGVILDNATTATTGEALSVRSGGTELFAIGGYGHILPNANPGTPSFTFNSGWNSPSPVTINGNDAAFNVQFLTGASTSTITINTAVFTINLANAYSGRLNFVAFINYGGESSTANAPTHDDNQGGIVSARYFYCVATGAGQITVYAFNSFAPSASMYYYFHFMTMGAGATS